MFEWVHKFKASDTLCFFPEKKMFDYKCKCISRPLPQMYLFAPLFNWVHVACFVITYKSVDFFPSSKCNPLNATHFMLWHHKGTIAKGTYKPLQFVNLEPCPWLPKMYTAYGPLTHGMRQCRKGNGILAHV